MKGGLIKKIVAFFLIGGIFSPSAKNKNINPEPGIKIPDNSAKKIKRKTTAGATRKKPVIANCKKIWRNWHVGKAYYE